MKKIFCIILASLLLALGAGCTADKADGDAAVTDPESTAAYDTTASEATADDTTKEEGKKLFEITESDGTYSYTLYNLDGSVADMVTGCPESPCITSLNDEILRVDDTDYTYYYHLESRIFSKEFHNVFSESGSLVLYAEENRITVCDMFTEDGIYKEFSDFSGNLAEDDPFISAEFIEDGSAIEVRYNTNQGQEFSDCFNISNGSKFVLFSDWLSELVVLTGQEKEQVISFLYGYMGTHDQNSGFPYEYQVKGKLTINGKDYYYCKSFCNVTLADGTVSQAPAGEFLLSVDRTERFDCRESSGTLKVYTENDLN